MTPYENVVSGAVSGKSQHPVVPSSGLTEWCCCEQEIFRRVKGVEALAFIMNNCDVMDTESIEAESVIEALILLLTYTQSKKGVRTLLSTGCIPPVLDIFRKMSGSRCRAMGIALKVSSQEHDGLQSILVLRKICALP